MVSIFHYSTQHRSLWIQVQLRFYGNVFTFTDISTVANIGMSVRQFHQRPLLAVK